MNPKKIIKLIDNINYTIPYKRNGVPLTRYDEGYKAACDQIRGAIVAMTFSPVLHYRYLRRSKIKNLKPCPFNSKLKCVQNPDKNTGVMICKPCPNVDNVRCYAKGIIEDDKEENKEEKNLQENQ